VFPSAKLRRIANFGDLQPYVVIRLEKLEAIWIGFPHGFKSFRRGLRHAIRRRKTYFLRLANCRLQCPHVDLLGDGNMQEKQVEKSTRTQATSCSNLVKSKSARRMEGKDRGTQKTHDFDFFDLELKIAVSLCGINTSSGLG